MLYYLFTLELRGWAFVAFFLAYIVAVAIAFSAHEFSHALVANWCGDRTAKSLGRMSVNPFKHIDTFGMLSFLFVGFGWAKPVPINPLKFRNYKRGIRLVSSSGVVTNFFLSFAFSAMFYFLAPLLNLSNVFFMFIFYLLMFSTTINLSLAIFNLLPIYPLDGFNFLSSFMRPDNKFVQFMYRYGSIILLIVVVLPIFDLIYEFGIIGLQSLFFKLWGLF